MTKFEATRIKPNKKKTTSIKKVHRKRGSEELHCDTIKEYLKACRLTSCKNRIFEIF